MKHVFLLNYSNEHPVAPYNFTTKFHQIIIILTESSFHQFWSLVIATTLLEILTNIMLMLLSLLKITIILIKNITMTIFHTMITIGKLDTIIALSAISTLTTLTVLNTFNKK